MQVLLLAYMGGQREYVVHTGRTVYLRTVPFDPRDYFRGDYVRLNYDISNIGKEYFRDGISVQPHCYYNRDRGKVVYAVLKVDDSKLASLDYVTDIKPSGDKLFIRGRVKYNTSSSIIVAYGIEDFYVQQGKGGVLENRLSGVAIEMELAVGNGGIAVLKGYRSSPLSITAKNFVEKDEIVQSCDIVITNMSLKPFAVVDLPAYGSLKFETASAFFMGMQKELFLPDQNTPALVQDKDVHILQSNQTYTFKIDFKHPYWQIKLPAKVEGHEFKEKDIARLIMSCGIVYESPSAEQCKGLENSHLIWHGKLTTNALNRYYTPAYTFPPFGMPGMPR